MYVKKEQYKQYTGNVLLCVVTMCILCDLPFNTPADPGIVRTAKSTSTIKYTSKHKKYACNYK